MLLFNFMIIRNYYIAECKKIFLIFYSIESVFGELRLDIFLDKMPSPIFSYKMYIILPYRWSLLEYRVFRSRVTSATCIIEHVLSNIHDTNKEIQTCMGIRIHWVNSSWIVYVIAVISQIDFALLCGWGLSYASTYMHIPQVPQVTDDFSRNKREKKKKIC